MGEAVAFMLYAAVFRLAVIAAGALAIWLGYKLFLNLPAAGGASGGGTDAEAQFGGARVVLKQAAPGTCFAVFGAVLISVMVVQGIPEFRRQAAAGPTESGSSLDLKGAGPPGAGFAAGLERADALLRAGDREAASAAYRRVLAHPDASLAAAARPLNQLAWLEHLAGNHAAAAALARLAVALKPDNPDYLDTLAKALEAKGLDGEAADVRRRLQTARP